MTPVIELTGVNKRFGKKNVLQNVSLAVPPGVVFALLGENGAGKSTLIRGMLGFHRFDSGSANVLSRSPVTQCLELRREIGYVPDAPAFYDWMRVRDCAWYASGFYKPGFLKRFSILAEEYELPADTLVRDLSKGTRSKLALALAMAFEPQLLMLDEPTSGLDPLVRRSFLETMAETAAAGRTVFICSHQIHEIERIADHVAILHDGQIRVSGLLDDLKNRYQILTLSRKDPLLCMPDSIADLDVLYENTSGRTTTMLVHGMRPEIGDQLTQHPNLMDVRVMRPSLEELYVGFTRRKPFATRNGTGSVAAEVA